ncbi:MAG TPA: ABC transporter permease, partial [Bacteroidia bacterium]
LKEQVEEFRDESKHPQWLSFTEYFLSEYNKKPDRNIIPKITWNKDFALKQVFLGSSSGVAWLKGNLGKSLMDGRPISKHLSDHIWPTLRLAIFSLIIALILGTGFGFLLARRNWKWADIVMTFIYSIPLFALATLLVSIIANWGEVSWIEIYGEETFEGDFSDINSFFRYLTLPAFLMALPLSIFIATNVRDRLKEQYSREYVRSARSLGIPEKNILKNHVWPNVKPYYLGFIGLLVPDLIAGSVIIEYIFARNGMGQYFLQATFYKDLPSILFLICLFGIIQFLGNTVSDILISKADKRLKS